MIIVGIVFVEARELGDWLESGKKRIAVFEVHPDDVVFSSFGFLSWLIKVGNDIHPFVITNGEAGLGDWRVRQDESRNYYQYMGTHHPQFLHFPDGSLSDESIQLNLYHRLSQILSELRPDFTVFLAPDMGVYPHTDHYATGILFTEGVQNYPPLLQKHNLLGAGLLADISEVVIADEMVKYKAAVISQFYQTQLPVLDLGKLSNHEPIRFYSGKNIGYS